MADTSLIKKLGIKPKQRIILLNAPEGYSEQIGALLPADVELLTTLHLLVILMWYFSLYASIHRRGMVSATLQAEVRGGQFMNDYSY